MWTFLWKVVSFFSLGKEMSLVQYTAAVITVKGFYNGARSKFFMNPIHIPSKVGRYVYDNWTRLIWWQWWLINRKMFNKIWEDLTVSNLDDALFLFKLFCIQHSRWQNAPVKSPIIHLLPCPNQFLQGIQCSQKWHQGAMWTKLVAKSGKFSHFRFTSLFLFEEELFTLLVHCHKKCLLLFYSRSEK